MGVVAPTGLTVAELFASQVAGRSGVGLITLFDARALRDEALRELFEVCGRFLRGGLCGGGRGRRGRRARVGVGGGVGRGRGGARGQRQAGGEEGD